MKKASVSHKGFGSNYNCIFIFRTLRTLTLMLVYWGCLVAPSLCRAAELKQGTLVYWNAYLDEANRQIGSQTPFLWVDQNPERLQRVRGGEILVTSVGKENPKPVDSGLIHDWLGAAFLPDTSIKEVLSAVRNYGDYKEYYKPTVVDSRLLSRDGPCEKYSIRAVDKEVVAQVALDMEYETCYFKIDDLRWYSVTHTTRVREIRRYGEADEQDLPPDLGSGYVWRLYSIAKYEQRDGGTYVEVEAIALSRDIPFGLRMLVSPIVRRVSKNSILASLQQTKNAVRSTEDSTRNAKSLTSADNGSRNGFVRDTAVTKGFAPNEKH